LVYSSDTVLLTGHRLLMLARAVLTVERFLRTCLHNAKGKRQTAIADRTAQMNLSDEEFACVFRSMPGHDSGASRAGIPVHAGPPFRGIPGRLR